MSLKMSTTVIKETDPLVNRNPVRSGSFDSGFGIYNKKWKYSYMFIFSILLLSIETGLWRKYVAPLCGSYCDLNLKKENVYFKFAENGFDYSEMTNLRYPAGVLYFYKGLNLILASSRNGFREAVPFLIFFHFLFLSAYLMKKCRIPAGLMFFFVLPLGLLLQGHALMFILPEMLAMAFLLQLLSALVAGYQKSAMILLVGALSFDSITIVPLLPALMLCLMRIMGARCAMFWMLLSLSGFAIVSGNYLLTNPTAYLIQVLGLQNQTANWNPIIWALNFYKLTPKFLISQSILPRILVHSCAQMFLINFRWLKSDGGILGLTQKFMKSTRGHGIRPHPWTPRQTLTVIFEAMLVSGLLRFPSLVHAEEFELLNVMLSGFFCVALADVVPLPALFGIFTALSFPLTFLYRQFSQENDVKLRENLHLHPDFKDSLHFLPMLLLPLVQLAVLVLFKRRDIGTKMIPNPPNVSVATAATNTNLLSNVKTFNNQQQQQQQHHHRRSSSLSRRKFEY